MRAKWHSHRTLGGSREYVLFVAAWEWRINDMANFVDKYVEEVFGAKVRWRACGPGLEGGSPTSSGVVMTRTLRQARARCEDAALRVVEAAAKDLGMKVVEDRR